ncbi:hypothetical protein J2S13_002806 [Oikeobacillus pervagus]|uniref:Uncharacterized protein n=1 Tax=Oikeobacillus pervagus TaxID=1325931 RepID=A0AAJ1WKB6_9BACI|nr:hypothetical protein [Oikeobacillus pervagus]MDQ0216348.1 hypothetical protein [Oikeobacillus pervagus]
MTLDLEPLGAAARQRKAEATVQARQASAQPWCGVSLPQKG